RYVVRFRLRARALRTMLSAPAGREFHAEDQYAFAPWRLLSGSDKNPLTVSRNLQRAVFHFRKVHHPSSAEQQAGDTSRSGIRPDRKYLIRLPLNSRKLAESSPSISLRGRHLRDACVRTVEHLKSSAQRASSGVTLTNIF